MIDDEWVSWEKSMGNGLLGAFSKYVNSENCFSSMVLRNSLYTLILFPVLYHTSQLLQLKHTLKNDYSINNVD